MFDQCKKADTFETGGILIGYYDETKEWAIVTDATKLPGDSVSGSNWLYRGIKGLQTKLSKIWAKNQYYLGEWHFHPFGMPIPSDTDRKQMVSISKSFQYSCPEPILILVGGHISNFSIKAYVTQGDSPILELIQIER
jgi:integrative and conjugative element protein (TIGR02256 family)